MTDWCWGQGNDIGNIIKDIGDKMVKSCHQYFQRCYWVFKTNLADYNADEEQAQGLKILQAVDFSKLTYIAQA